MKRNIYQFSVHRGLQSMFHQRILKNRTHTVIINADDFGVVSSIDHGIIELLTSRRISSVSVIVNEQNSQKGAEAMLKLKQVNPQIFESTSIGLHFNLTRGQPLSEFMKATRFVQDGQFVKTALLKDMPGEGQGQAIADEFRQQVKKFIRIFKRRPSHVDGHNHVHIHPTVAKAISGLLSEFGIYKIRLPSEKQLLPFGESLSNYIKYVRQLYEKNSIIWPEIFLGSEDSGNLKAQKIRKCLESNVDNKVIELMCHPGYPAKTGSGWTSKEDRLKQKLQLESSQFEILQAQTGGLSSYFDLQAKLSSKNLPRLLIYSKLQTGTGNYTTTLRLKAIFEKIGFEVYTWSVQSDIEPNIQAQDLQRFLISFGITLILGINVSRSGKIIHEATHSRAKIRMQVPYILVIAGTDANYTFQDTEKYRELAQSLKWSQCIVSISNDMTNITRKILNQLHIQKKIFTIVQSSCLGCKLSKLKINATDQIKEASKISTTEHKYILFPTSFRRIKCVQHVFKQLNDLIQKYTIDVYIMGPIIERDYYDEIKDGLGLIRYVGTLNHEEYSQKLASAFAIINCSETEGMSCSILEALQFGIPVVARNNAGNKELITHNYNGLIYDTPEEFASNFQKIIEDASLRQQIIQNGKKIFNQNYSLGIEIKQYQCMIQKEINNKTMQLTLNNRHVRVFNEPHVHNTSEVNNRLYLQIEPKIQQQAKILDFGCGTAVFSLLFLIKPQFRRIKLFLVDINEKILGNAIFNCRQSSIWHNLEIVAIKQSQFFSKVDKYMQFDAILFNPPQTPFQNSESRLDKNGGINGIKFYQAMLRYFAESSNQHLYLLHSYLAWPARLKELLNYYKLKCVWRSEKGVHTIRKEDYDQMEHDLSSYIVRHWEEGRADITLEGNCFSIPAEIQLIVKE